MCVRSRDAKARKGGRGPVRTLEIPRGHQPAIDPEGKWLVCRIKPEHAKTRGERIARKKKEDMSKDSLAVVDLSTMTVKKFPSVESYSSGRAGMPLIAYKSSWKGKKSGLIILTPGSWRADTLRHIDRHVFSDDGRLIAMTAKKDKKDSLSKAAVILARLSPDRAGMFHQPKMSIIPKKKGVLPAPKQKMPG